LTLGADIDCENETFAVSVAQQGPRLLKYRVKDESDKFVPVRFNLIVMTEEGQLGRYTSYKRFHQSVVLKEGKLSKDKSYFVYVQFAENDS